jgi:hypothetical protein
MSRIERYARVIALAVQRVAPETSLEKRNLGSHHPADLAEPGMERWVASKDPHHAKIALQAVASLLELRDAHHGRLAAKLTALRATVACQVTRAGDHDLTYPATPNGWAFLAGSDERIDGRMHSYVTPFMLKQRAE